MLVLRRKIGQSIVIGGTITVTVLTIDGERIKLGIEAPPEITITRQELLLRHTEGQQERRDPDSHP